MTNATKPNMNRAHRPYCVLKQIVLIVGLCVAGLLDAATLTGSVDRNRISLNETLIFQLQYNDKVDTDQLDLQQIRQDFDILGLQPSSSSNVSIINGQMSRETSTTWTLTLAPKREGTLVIPSFNVAGNVSDAIRIEVSKTPEGVTPQQPMVVNLSTDTSEAYPGQQIIIKVELLAQNRVSNLSGEQLSLEHSQIELLNQQSRRKIDKGISWQVVEWTYAVFPEKPGTLAIPAQLFSGMIS